jgi:hypothetical protein
MLFNDEAFSHSVEAICREVLAQWTLTESSVLQLRDILSLVPLLPTLGRPLAGLVDSLVQLDLDSFQNYQTTAANAAWCLGSSMLALSKIKGWKDGMNLDPWFQHCLSRYNWSSKVLEGLVSLSHLSYVPLLQTGQIQTNPFQQCLDTLHRSPVGIGSCNHVTHRRSSISIPPVSCIQSCRKGLCSELVRGCMSSS